MGENPTYKDYKEKPTESPKDQKEKLFKESLETAINGGVEITDENNFERFKKLLKTHYNLDIDNIKFNELNNGTGVFIKQKGDGKFFVYNLNNKELLGTNLVELGVIETNNYNKTNWFIGLFSSRESRQKGTEYKIPEEPQIESTITKKPNDESIKKIKVEKPDELYTIKKGEYFWKIISEKYGLRTEVDKNAIWNIMEIVRKDPRNKNAIKNIDTIFAGEKLYLPKEVEIKKGKDTKKISLKSDNVNKNNIK